MSKRYRLFILLAVLGVCFLFLLPSIRWHFLTPADQQELAMQTREEIRTFATEAALADFNQLLDAARNNGPVPQGLEFITERARRIHREHRRPMPNEWDARSVLAAFAHVAQMSEREVINEIASQYLDEIFALKDLQRNAVSLGLDLAGGLSIQLQADMAALSERMGRSLNEEDRREAMERALDVLNSRIDRFGLTEPVIRRQGADQILVEIPGTADPELIHDIIMGRGSLTFHLEDEQATAAFNALYRASPPYTIVDQAGNLLDPSLVPEDVMILGVFSRDRYGFDIQETDIDGTRRFVAVKREVGLDGTHIQDALVERDPLDPRPNVTFRLDAEGGDIFFALTSANRDRMLNIVLDGRVRSRAVITTSIRDAVRISGFDAQEAQTLALILRTAALPVELEVISQQSIGASLGEDTIRQGLLAFVGGIVSVFIFMLIFYKTAGINAVLAQILNFYIMFSILSALNFTLTLPAIAGFILTIGMSTDASVIIFERMKEELRLGKSRLAVIEAGFNKAFWTIMDVNITTFIAAMFLSLLGSGPIRGFAITLAIGVFSSVFTALFVSRLMFDFSTDVLKSKKLRVTWARIQGETQALGGVTQ